MNTPNYINRLSEIRDRVGQYAILEKPRGTIKSKIPISVPVTFSKITLKSPLFYIIPPIAIFILLLIWKPGFVSEDSIDKDNVVTKKRKYKSILIISLVAGMILDIGMFAYFRKNKD